MKRIAASTEKVSKSGSIYALGVYGGGNEVTQRLISKWDVNRKTLEEWELILLNQRL